LNIHYTIVPEEHTTYPDFRCGYARIIEEMREREITTVLD